MRIGNFDTNAHVLIVAEIGNNHEGSFTLAQELIGRAAEAGADAVKFQTIVPELLVEPSQVDRIAQLRRICLPAEDFPNLKNQADEAGLLFLSTPFAPQSVAMLDPLVPAFKIASADNNYFPLLDAVAVTGKPILLSTGLADLQVIGAARDRLRLRWAERQLTAELALLHCVSSYPTPRDEANLLAIRQLADLGETVGYSDHTLGIEAAVLSVAMGARIVEKHFTIDKAYSNFRDHQLSADPQEMALLVRRIRDTEIMLGSGRKHTMPCEAGVFAQARRSAVAADDLPSGTILDRRHVLWLRPGGGIPPSRAHEVVGRRLLRPLGQGERIEATYLSS